MGLVTDSGERGEAEGQGSCIVWRLTTDLEREGFAMSKRMQGAAA